MPALFWFALTPAARWSSAQPAAIDAQRLLPPPPAAGSAKDTAELDELRHLQVSSTPDQLAAAAYDDKHEDGTIFASVLGPDFDIQAITQYDASAEIVMGHGPKPAGDPRAFDARAVQSHLAGTIQRPAG